MKRRVNLEDCISSSTPTSASSSSRMKFYMHSKKIMGYTTQFLVEPIIVVLYEHVNILKLSMTSLYIVLGLDQCDKDLINRKTNEIFNQYLIIISDMDINRQMIIEKGVDGDDVIFINDAQFKVLDEKCNIIGENGQRFALCITRIQMKDNDIRLMFNIHQVRNAMEPEKCRF